MPKSREYDHLLSSRFRVEIEGVNAEAFAEVSGIESRTEVIEYADGNFEFVSNFPDI